MSKLTEEPVLSDELILEFEQQIKDEEAQKVPIFKQYAYFYAHLFFRYLLCVKMNSLVN